MPNSNDESNKDKYGTAKTVAKMAFAGYVGWQAHEHFNSPSPADSGGATNEPAEANISGTSDTREGASASDVTSSSSPQDAPSWMSSPASLGAGDSLGGPDLAGGVPDVPDVPDLPSIGF